MCSLHYRFLSQCAVRLEWLLVVQSAINNSPQVKSSAVKRPMKGDTQGSQSDWMSLATLHTRPAFHFWRTKGAVKLYSAGFLSPVKVSVAYLLTAAPSTDSRTRLPFCTSHTHGWLSPLLSLCPPVSLSFLTLKHTRWVCTRRWSSNSPAVARACSIFRLFHLNTCSCRLPRASLIVSFKDVYFFHSPRNEQTFLCAHHPSLRSFTEPYLLVICWLLW